MIRALDHRLADRRVMAARVLGARGSRAAIPALTRIIAEDTDHHLAQAAVRALAKIGGDEAWAVIARVAVEGTTLPRQAALEAIGRPSGEIQLRGEPDEMPETATSPSHEPVTRNRNVLGIGLASLLSDSGHEAATAVLPGFFRAIGAPAAALGITEGIADAALSLSKLVGGEIADRTEDRKKIASGGYLAVGVGLATIALAPPWGWAAAGRAVAWSARGFRTPPRDALLAGSVPPQQLGRAFGLERAMDSIGAVIGPLIGALILSLSGSFRLVFLAAAVPQVLAGLAIWRLVKDTRGRRPRTVGSWRRMLHLPPELRDVAMALAFYAAGNFAPTLLILRATDLLGTDRPLTAAAGTAVLLYTLHNAAAALSSYPAGALADRIGRSPVVALGYGLFAAASAGFAFLLAPSVVTIGLLFVLAGSSLGLVEAGSGALVSELVPDERRGRAYGVLGVIDSAGDLVASSMVGILYTTVGAGWAFGWGALLAGLGAAWMAIRRPRANPDQ
ncbi:MAG: MFS transporter [Acidimicrobiia bacterium]